MHIHNLWFNGETLKHHFDSDPRIPLFLLYVRSKSGVTFVRICFRDEPLSPSSRRQCQWRL